MPRRRRKMKMTMRVFSSFEEAEKADLRDWASLTPNERVAAMELLPEGPQRFANGRSSGFRRIWRLVERE